MFTCSLKCVLNILCNPFDTPTPNTGLLLSSECSVFSFAGSRHGVAVSQSALLRHRCYINMVESYDHAGCSAIR